MQLERKQAGDTIVEVLIAIAISAIVLSAAYVASTRASAQNRAAIERGEALGVAQTQLERLKKQAVDPTPSYNADTTSSYCLDDSLNQKLVLDGELNTNNNCRFGSRYYATISYQTIAGERVYRVLVLWENVTGSSTSVDGRTYLATDQLMLSYKVN